MMRLIRKLIPNGNGETRQEAQIKASRQRVVATAEQQAQELRKIVEMNKRTTDVLEQLVIEMQRKVGQ